MSACQGPDGSCSLAQPCPSNPARLWINEQTKLHTTVKSHTQHPRWNETFRMTVHEFNIQTLHFVMFDSDTLRRDDEIGGCVLARGRVRAAVAIAHLARAARSGRPDPCTPPRLSKPTADTPA